MWLTCLEDSWELKQSGELRLGMNSGQAQCFPQSFLRIELGFGFPGCVSCFLLSQGLQKRWERGCPVEGSWALPAEAGPAQPRRACAASEVAAPLQSCLVCIMGEVFIKLLLLSAPFPSKNGQRPPSSLWTEFLDQSTDLGGLLPC